MAFSFKQQWQKIRIFFGSRRVPTISAKHTFRQTFKFFDWKRIRHWRISKEKLRDWRANWRTHLANLPAHLASFPDRIPRDFSLNKNTLIYLNCLAIVLCSYFVADLASVIITPFLPDPPAKKVVIKRRNTEGIRQYDIITKRNLFNKDGLIPDTESMGPDINGPPVKTSLPLELMGIIILKDSLKNVASVNDRSRNDVVAVKVNDFINPQAQVQKIEEDKLIFINKANNRREYIELPFEMQKLKTKTLLGPTKGSGVSKVDDTHLLVERTEVDKALANMSTVLTEARCIPNTENGKPAGFRCFQIVPGSIYDKLGIKDNDVITAVNGTELLDPGQVFDLFNQLKSANTNSIELTIKRNRQTMNMQYDIQ